MRTNSLAINLAGLFGALGFLAGICAAEIYRGTLGFVGIAISVISFIDLAIVMSINYSEEEN